MTGRVVLVSGASRGIGAALAAQLAAAGDTVIGLARRDVDQWEPTTESLADRKLCDVQEESAVKRLFSDIRKQYGRLDVLINNAGAFSGDLLMTASAARFASVLAGNLVSVHVVTREAVKLMRPAGHGRVVAVSSIAARIGLVGNALYATSKSAMESMMAGYAIEFRGSGITFNAVEVSFVEGTAMVDALKPEARERYEQRLLVPRPVTLDEVGAAVAYLASDAAGSVTGQVIALGSPS